MNAYIVVNGTHARYVEANTPEAAALYAAGTTSIGSLRTGVTFSVYPVDFAKKVRVQYENPLDNSDVRFGDNLGKPILVEEFVEVPRLGVFG